MREKQEDLSKIIQAQFHQQVDFLRRLVLANSVNPFTPETTSLDAPVEKAVAEIVQRELHRFGFQVDLVGASSQRPNVVCHIPGTGKLAKTLILTTHMDTVPASDRYTRDPWGAQVDHGRLYGVRAADAKAQIAAFIYAARALQEAGRALDGNIILAFVVDEEIGACSPYGTSYLLNQETIKGDAAIVGEPGSDKVAIAHRGLYRFRLCITGEAVHTGLKAWEQGITGRNAILDMARFSQRLSEVALPDAPSSIFPGRRSLITFPTLIKGGRSVNIVPDICEAYGDVRLLPGLSVDTVKQVIKDQLASLAIQDYQLDDLIVVPAAETNPQAEIVRCLAASIEMITGTPPRLEGAGPACDGWMFISRGIPTVCGYGVTCGGVHGADEWVDLESLRWVTEVYAHTILRYCGEV